MCLANLKEASMTIVEVKYKNVVSGYNSSIQHIFMSHYLYK